MLPVNACLADLSSRDGDTVLYSDSFNGEITNSHPSKTAISGANVHIIERTSGKDKAAYFEADNKAASVQVNLDAAVRNIGLSFDVKINQPKTALKLSLTNGKEAVSLLKMSDDGTMRLHNDYRVSGISVGNYTNISVTYNSGKKSYSVYFDGKKAISDWYIKTGAPDGISGFKAEFTFEGNAAAPSAVVDNIFMYEGQKYIPSAEFKKGAYNSGSVEYLAKTKSKPAQSIYMSYGFDLANNALKTTPNDNTMELAQDKSTGNFYFSAKRSGSSDLFFDVKAAPVSTSFVFEMDLKYKKAAVPFTMYLRGNAGSAGLIKISGDSVVSAVGNVPLAKLSKTQWVRVALVYNKNRAVYDFYCNGEQVKSGIETTVKNETLSDFRFYSPAGSEAELMIDNILIYDGEAPNPEYADALPKPAAVTNYEAEVLESARECVIFSDYSDYAFYGGEKKKLADNALYKEGDRLMASADLYKEIYNMNIEYNAESGLIKLAQNTSLALNSLNALTAGRSIVLNAAPTIKDGKLYIGVEDVLGTIFGKSVTKDAHGLTIISDGKSFSEDKITKISNYMIYDHPTPKQLDSIFNSRMPGHPRILADRETFEALKAGWKNDPNKKIWGETLIKTADSYRKNPDNIVKYKPGNDIYKSILTIAREVYQKSKILGMAYWLTGDEGYVTRLWGDISAAAQFPDWNPLHPLDMSELLMAFAIAYDWCYDVWTPQQKTVMEQAMLNLGIKPYYEAQYGGRMAWTIIEKNNRGIVNNTGDAVAALAMYEKDPEMFSQLIANTLWGMDNPLECYFPGGSWPEGAMYWGYAHDYLVNYLSTVMTVYGTDFNLLRAIGMNKSAEFAMYTMGATSADTFHDSEYYVRTYADCVYWLAEQFNDTNSRNIMLAKAPNKGMAQALLWYNPDSSDKSFSVDNDNFFYGDDDYFSMRSSWTDDSATILNGHAGQGEGGHSHLDTGTFILDMLGERWAHDLGKDDYNIKGLDKKETRYLYYRYSPQGHNCLVINPGMDDTFYDMDSFCPVYRKEFKEKGGYVIYDMTPAQSGRATDAKRGFRLDDNRRSAVVRDEVTLAKQNSDVYWFMQTKADIEVVSNQEVILSIGSKKVRIRFLTNADDINITYGGAKPLEGTSDFAEQADNEALGYKRLCVKMKASGSMYIQAKFTAVGDLSDDAANENKALADWAAPDGKLEKMPVVSNISVNGETVNDFTPTTVSYDCMVEDMNNKPPVTVTAPDDVEIKQETVGNSVIITARNKNGSLYRRYSVNYKLITYMPDIDGMTRIPVYKTSASSFYSEESYHTYANDNDLSTGWVSDGDGEYLVLDLGKQQSIDAVGVSVVSWGEQQRQYTFDIEVSNDEIDWTTVKKGLKNTVFDDSIQTFAFDRVNARYIRFVGHCSNVKSFNSVTEFAALAKK